LQLLYLHETVHLLDVSRGTSNTIHSLTCVVVWPSGGDVGHMNKVTLCHLVSDEMDDHLYTIAATQANSASYPQLV